jgi:centromere/kinetochore protein ZW10
MASGNHETPLGDTLIQFSVDGKFPEEEAVSAAYVEDSALPVALKALNDAQTELEVCS